MTFRVHMMPARRLLMGLSVLALAVSPVAPVRAQEKADADAQFLTKVVPAIAASVKIIQYEVKNTSNEKVREFAERVLKQHQGSVQIAGGHAKRLNIAVDPDGDKPSKEMIDKLSKLKGAELDAAFLQWLGHVHHDTTLFDEEVKNGADAELKTYARNSIAAGNEHLKEAHELLAEVKKAN